MCTGFFPGKYCRTLSLVKIEFSFPLRPHSGRGQQLGFGVWRGGGGGEVVQVLNPRILF